MSRHHHVKQPGRLTCPLHECACTRGADDGTCRQCTLDYHCGSHDDGCHDMCAGPCGRKWGAEPAQPYRPRQRRKPPVTGMQRGEIAVDEHGRTSLARVRTRKFTRYSGRELADGTIILHPLVTVPASMLPQPGELEERRTLEEPRE